MPRPVAVAPDLDPRFPSEEARRHFLGSLMNAIEISTQAEVRSRLARLALRCGAREREWERYLEESTLEAARPLDRE